ncbi:MAG: hypothetical protein AAGA77_21315 [Bacteroidota bacterium]
MNIYTSLRVCFLLLAYSYSGHAQSIEYHAEKDSIVIENLSPPDTIAKNPNNPYWRSFWEYGDSHYSFDTLRHVYRYDETGTKEVRVMLTPHYSFNNTKTLTKFIQPQEISNAPKIYPISENKYVHIESSARNELVPDNEIRVVVHYSLPPNVNAEEGYLFIFFNNKTEMLLHEMPFHPFRSDTLAYGDRLYGGYDSDIFDFKAEPWVARESLITQMVDEVASDYASAKIIKCPIQKGQDKRLFFSLISSPELSKLVLGGEKENLNVHIRALWVYEGVNINATNISARYNYKMLSVHDPNEIKILRPKGNPYYHPKRRQTFEFEVHFENKGGRAAKNVDVIVPWPDNLDYNTIQIVGRDPAPKDNCADCPPDFDMETGKQSCFMIDTSLIATNDTLFFKFLNVGLMGKQEPGLSDKKYTKGLVRFTVKSNGKYTGVQQAKATIHLEGDNPLRTKVKKKQWRMRSICPSMGGTLFAGMPNFNFNNNQLSRYYTLGISLINAPLYSGYGRRWELSSSGLGFIGRKSDDIQGDTQVQLTNEEIDLQTIDFQFFLEKRMKGIFSVGAGIGPSIPISGEGEITSRQFSAQDIPPGFTLDDIAQSSELFDDLFPEIGDISEEVNSSFGLLNSFADNSIISNRSIGFVGSLFVEVGFLSKYALGIRSNYRIYPGSYKERCLQIRDTRFYLRISLFTL